jgi:diketogulonate reductase-like aldo/keto reductase
LVDHPTIQEITKNNKLDVAKVIILWHLAKGWCVLPKSSTEERIRQNILVDGLSLTAEEVAQIDELGKTHKLKICWNPNDYA